VRTAGSTASPDRPRRPAVAAAARAARAVGTARSSDPRLVSATILSGARARRPPWAVPGRGRSDLAHSQISAKISRLLRRVPPDHVRGRGATLITESHLPDRPQCSACPAPARSSGGDPISPTNRSGATRNTTGTRVSCRANTGDTPDRGGRRRWWRDRRCGLTRRGRVVNRTRTRYLPGGVRDR